MLFGRRRWGAAIRPRGPTILAAAAIVLGFISWFVIGPRLCASRTHDPPAAPPAPQAPR